MAKLNSLSDFCTKVQKGTFCVVMLTSTIPTMRKTNNPYIGRVVKVSYRTNVALGWGYQDTINGRLDKKGLSADFVAEKPKGKTWIAYPFFLEKDADTSVQYIRTFTRNNTTTKSVFVLDGTIVTDANIIADIQSFIPSHKTSAKQESFGLVEDSDKVNLLDYITSNVLYIAQGAEYYAQSDDFAEMLNYIRGLK
jgi:hypothetical protein